MLILKNETIIMQMKKHLPAFAFDPNTITDVIVTSCVAAHHSKMHIHAQITSTTTGNTSIADNYW